MTHQYESEVLNKLMERDGINIPSLVPPYEAEIKGYLINQVKQAYPKLTDYEAEWLLYNYTKHLPADFPISSVSNVTEASFENVVPFAYQSAILKGNTLVNLLKPSNNITVDANGTWITNNPEVINESMIKPSTTYTLITYVHNNTIADGGGYVVGVGGGNQQHFLFSGNQVISPNQTGVFKLLMTTKSDTTLRYALQQVMHNTNTHGSITFSQVLLEGDYTTADITYFEGMQSVKMPVLTTTGKNICDMVGLANTLNKIDNKIVVIDESTWEMTSTPSYHNVNFKYRPIKFKENTSYTISFEGQTTDDSRTTLANIIKVIYIDGTESNMRSIGFNKVTTPSNKTIDHVRFSYGVLGVKESISNLSIVEGESTSYEPYKSNILSCNEEVILRGIGDVKDTLDGNTGELTQRIGEVVLSSDLLKTVEVRTRNGGSFIVGKLSEIGFKNTKDIISNLRKVDYYGSEAFQIGDMADINGGLGICFSTDGVNNTKEQGLLYLDSIRPKVYGVLTTPTIKTVDLKIVNESGESIYFMPLEGTMHVQSSGEPIQPTFDMSVPVEATTQNLASFIDLEMEE